VTLGGRQGRPAPGAAELQNDAKRRVYEFWNEASCGEALLLPGTDAEACAAQRRERYRLEPFIPAFANFRHWRGKRVLDVGVGLGADHDSFAAAKAELYGIDLTERAIEHTRARLAHAGLRSTLAVAGAEALPFPDGHFDLVYSWGVLHHSPSPERALDGVARAAPRRHRQAHALSQPERGRLHAVGALRAAARATVAAPARDLLRAPGDPRHARLQRGTSARSVLEVRERAGHARAHTRRSAELRGRPAPPRGAARRRAPALAAPRDPALVLRARRLPADHGDEGAGMKPVFPG
jgi:hypothetical protein